MKTDYTHAARERRRIRRKKLGEEVEPQRRSGRPRLDEDHPALDTTPVPRLLGRALERVDELLPDEDWLVSRGVDILNPDPDQLERWHIDVQLWELACVLTEAVEIAEEVAERNRYEHRRDWSEYASADPRGLWFGH